MILYIENPKDATKKTVRINKFSKVAEYKNQYTKSVMFTYTNNKLSEREIRRQPHLHCNKKNKIPRNKFNQGGEIPVL